MEKKAKEEILKEAFLQMTIEKKPEKPLEPVLEKVAKTVFPLPNVEGRESKEVAVEQRPSFLREELLKKSLSLNFEVPQEEQQLFLKELPELSFPLSQKALEPSPLDKVKPAKVEIKTVLDLTPPDVQGFFLTGREKESFPKEQKTPLASIAPLKPELVLRELKWHTVPTLKELDTLSYSESFDIEVLFLESDEEDGYLFALTLIPKEEIDLPPIRQHYTFLIDRSNSVLEGRLRAVKSAVNKAISKIDTQDTFNIITFDSKMQKLSPVPLTPSKKTKREAKEFLDHTQLGSFFASGDLYKPLFLTVPSHVGEDEIFTAILITDGEQLSKRNMQHALIRDWTAYNEGKVSLFGLGIGDDPHLRSLEAASLFNRGKLVYSSTTRGIKRKLLKLMKMVEMPIAKNLSCSAISEAPQTEIELFLKASQSSHLYAKEPYTLLGKTKHLDDFILFVQGRVKGKWLNIKKKVSFLNAKGASASLQEEWALQKAFRLYETYLLENDPKYLVEAREVLLPFHLEASLK